MPQYILLACPFKISKSGWTELYQHPYLIPSLHLKWKKTQQYITLKFQLETKTAPLYLKEQQIYPSELFIASVLQPPKFQVLHFQQIVNSTQMPHLKKSISSKSFSLF